jgi:LPPG:FO 2-phospho-L-lactate transferase
VVVVLAGGTGGAKLAAGVHDLVGPGQLTVVANTGDDVEAYGVHVSPDPDLVTYWLAGAIDERGWGIRDDTWSVMDALEAAGQDVWFRLGDRDLAMCLIRTARLRAGERLTDAHAAVVEACGVQARVLPMSDDPVRTHVRSGGEWLEFQRFMIVEGAAAPIEAVEPRGADRARPSPEVLDAIRSADAVVIGPSNPVISIGPILAVPGIRAALEATDAPVVAVSPFVDGRAVKGPTDAFMEHSGHPRSAAGVAAAYAGLLDGIVSDEDPGGLPVPNLMTATLMDDAAARRDLAATTLGFASSLRRAGPGPGGVSR